MIDTPPLQLSGQRFRVVYRLTCDAAEAFDKATDICVEQTIEFPADLVPPGDIREHIIGRIEALRTLDPRTHEAEISYAVETTGFELTQLLNVVFGNTSIKPGVRVERLDLPEALLAAFKGPRFGRAGLRQRLGVPHRPLLCTAIKPMGLPAASLADMTHRLALGGIDVIKDDHGLANQPFAPFEARVERCAEAVARANAITGLRCVYAPNVTGPMDRMVEMALFARRAGAGGLLIAPGLAGWDAVRRIADDDRIGLPILFHPAFTGSFVTSPDNGLSHFVLYGQLARLIGADAAIYPNFGGRFSFSKAECHSIVAGTEAPMAHIQPIFPTPGGGMTLDKVPEMFEVYGRDVMFLIGGGLHRHGPDLAENARYFRELAEQMGACA